MSAFSADKRRNNFLHQLSQGYSTVPPNMTSSPGQRPTHAPGGHRIQCSLLGAPMGAAGPLGPRENISKTWGGSYSSSNYNNPPYMRDVNFPNSGVDLGESPHAVHGWGRGGRYSNRPQLHSHHDSPNMLDVNFPNSGVGRGDSPHAVHGWGSRGGRYSNSPRPQLHCHHDSANMLDVNFPNSGVGQGDSPHAVHGWSRGGRYRPRPQSQPHSRHHSRHGSGHYSDWGRGRGQSLSLGPSARRGKDSQDPVSAELRPDLYYNKEMLEDPWKGMTPVIWKGPSSDGSWLPKSLSLKKTRPSPEASQKSVSQPSLAEYLATSNDTVNEPTHERHEQPEVSES